MSPRHLVVIGVTRPRDHLGSRILLGSLDVKVAVTAQTALKQDVSVLVGWSGLEWVEVGWSGLRWFEVG